MQKNDATIHNQIRRVELYTRRLVSTMLVGSGRSAQKGTGFEFDQISEYQFGDDVRTIDWSATARTQRWLIRQYREERNRVIMLLVDGSLSMQFGLYDKFERAAWI